MARHALQRYPERDITGALEADPYRVFAAWAQTLPQCIGNPLYHWTYLELKRYFGITEELCPETAAEIYEKIQPKAGAAGYGVRGLIEQSEH